MYREACTRWCSRWKPIGVFGWPRGRRSGDTGRVRFVVLFVALATAMTAQDREERRAAYPQTFALTELARSAPPEFAARGLLHLLEADAIPTREWQLEIAKEALTLAGAARHPVGKKLAPGIVALDSQAMLWNVAYGQGLDSLTLRLRAIEQLRRLDPAAAKKAFSELPRPALSQAACKDPLLEDASRWYRVAASVEADPLPMIQSIQTHGELAPAIDLIFQRRNTPEELDTLAGAIGQKLRELPANDRPFTAALYETPRKLQHLYKVRPTAALAEGWRAWMQAGLEATACEESRKPGSQEQARRDAWELFNRTFEQPLNADLMKPAGTAEETKLGSFAQTESTQRQTKLFQELLFGNKGRGLSAAEKDTPEWREQMQKYIQSIEGRTRGGDESDIEFFYRQSQLWAGVLMAEPAGPTRERALQQYIAFLLMNAPHIDPLIWFSQVESMAELTRSLHGNEFGKTLQALHLTGHPVLQLYAALEAAYPTRPTAKAN